MVPTALAVTYVILSMSIYYKSTANSASHLSNKQMQFEGPMSVLYYLDRSLTVSLTDKFRAGFLGAVSYNRMSPR